jgi:hypothetical protein
MVAQALSPILASGTSLELVALLAVVGCYAAFEAALWITRNAAGRAPGEASPQAAAAVGSRSRSISAANLSFVEMAQLDVDSYGDRE